jgi:hypothetical protein
MKIEDMNEGVRILLERMKTNPEEFESPFGKWQHVMEQVMERVGGDKNVVPFLHQEEIQALFAGLRDMERNKFTASILRSLAEVDEEGEQLSLPYVRAILGNQRMRNSTKKERKEVLESYMKHKGLVR